MKWLAIATVIATGCGRLDFGRADAVAVDVVLANHDEDGDGVDDAIDKCPMIADDQTDADGDGVGAACDPDDASPTEALVLFDPMLTMSADITFPTGTWTQGVDEVVETAITFSELDRAFAVTDADIWIGLDIQSISGTTQQVITHPSVTTIPLRYYGQLYHTSGVNAVGVQSYDGITFTGIDMVPLSAQGIHTGQLVMVTRMRTSPASIDFRTGWGSESYHVMGAAAAYTGSPHVRIQLDGMVVGVRFMAVIATN